MSDWDPTEFTTDEILEGFAADVREYVGDDHVFWGRKGYGNGFLINASSSCQGCGSSFNTVHDKCPLGCEGHLDVEFSICCELGGVDE